MNSIWQPIFDKAMPPVYRQDEAGRSLFYAPGLLVVVPATIASNFQAAITNPECGSWPEAIELRRQAVEAQKAWESLQTTAFAPVCLTLYLNNVCNLNCVYCFSKPYRSARTRLSLDMICAAAEIVAANCRTHRRPLTVVFHGGGEPTLDYEVIRQALSALNGIAARYSLELFRYIATNAVMPPARAYDLATRFDLIGLSCDGPPEIQNLQRPLHKQNKHISSWFIEQTAQAIHRAGKPLHVRVTITPETSHRQAEIAEYICQMLRPQEVHVEPVYAVDGNKTKIKFDPVHAERYVSAFLEARHVAQKYGVCWRASGSRPAEIHSAYCHIWRNVLNLTPEGVATLCFQLSDANSVYQQHLELGEWDAQKSCFKLNTNHVQNFQQAIHVEPEACTLCFNRHHCARECPDICILKSGYKTGGFRCRVQSMLTEALIQETADALCLHSNIDHPVLGKLPEHP